MLLDKDDMRGIIRELLNQTRKGKMMWNAERDRYWVDLPNRMTITLLGNEVGPLKADIQRTLGDVVGAVEFSQSEMIDEEAEALALYEAAKSTAKRVIYADIIDSIKFSDSATTTKTTTTTTLPPAYASAEVSSGVLRKMAGRWALDYSRGKEIAVISEHGAYSIEGKQEPTFCLVVLAVNQTTSRVEVAKDLPGGRRRQIEYLTITEDEMSGYAKHDGHRLTYRRLKS